MCSPQLRVTLVSGVWVIVFLLGCVTPYGTNGALYRTLAIIMTSSARELASIFSITCPRCALTVRIVIPNSYAICLLGRPETTRSKTSCSRGVKVFNPLRIFSSFTECALNCDRCKNTRNLIVNLIQGPEVHVRLSESRAGLPPLIGRTAEPR